MSKNLSEKLSNKEYRSAYTDESVKITLPFQIKAMREQRGWSQADLAEKAGMKPNAISRLESVDYGNFTINTLLKLAHAFDCALFVKFTTFNNLLAEFSDVSPKALEVESFNREVFR